MKAAVITCVYQALEVIPALVQCNLISQTEQDIEYIIGDDCSPNIKDNIEMFKQFIGIKNLTIFTLADRIPWSLPDLLNISVSLTSADYLILSYADVLFIPDTIEKHLIVQEKRGPLCLEGSLKYFTDIVCNIPGPNARLKPEEMNAIAEIEHKVFSNPSIVPTLPLYGYARRPVHDYPDPYICMEKDCPKCNTRQVFFHGTSLPRDIFVKLGGIRPEFSGKICSLDVDFQRRLAVAGIQYKQSLFPVAVQLWKSSVHNAPRNGDDILVDKFKVGLPGNYINKTQTNRKYNFIIKKGEWTYGRD